MAYRAAGGTTRFELREKGSRFLAIVEPVMADQAARERIRFFQRQYRDASHVCWAWRVGSPAIESRSDAGEPAGTAGTPMLQVLRGTDLSDVLAVVVRWFGGTRLGKGGLARAYAGAVKGALAELAIVERQPVTRVEVLVPHSRLGDLKRLIRPPEVELVEESYAEEALLILNVQDAALGRLVEIVEGFAARIDLAGTRHAGRNRLDGKLTEKEERSS